MGAEIGSTHGEMINRLHRSMRLAFAFGVVASLATVTAEWVPPASAVPPAHLTSKIATCVVPGSTGHSTEWFARYKVAEGQKSEIHVVGVGEHSSDSNSPSTSLRPWMLTWATANQAPATVRKLGPDIKNATFSAEKMQMLSPDGKCILYLSAVPTPPHRVAVIGDSVFANIAQTVAKKALGAESYAQSWQISATSGNGWNATPVTWPLKVVDGDWAIDSARGLAESQPSVLVVELGADDALRAVFASVTAHPKFARDLVTGVSKNIGELIDQESPQLPCTVLVTAPAFPTDLFGAGEAYVTEAVLVNAAIREQALRHRKSDVRLADWAAFSAAHHSPVGPSKDWFAPGDNVHPNLAGEKALISLIHRVIKTCAK